jgi:hypothetical protein
MSRFVVIWITALACACHSTSLEGDADSDPLHDVPTEASLDPSRDIIVDRPRDPASDCVPIADEWPSVTFLLDGELPSEYNLQLVCTLEGLEEDPEVGTLELVLACRSDEGLIEEHRLFFAASPYVPVDTSLFEGVDLILSYVSYREYYYGLDSHWVSVSSVTSGLLVAGIYSWGLGYVDPGVRDDWYEPLVVRRVEGGCPGVENECGTLQRQALELSFSDGSRSVTVYDGNAGLLEDPAGSYHVAVHRVFEYWVITCDFLAPTGVEALILRVP